MDHNDAIICKVCLCPCENIKVSSESKEVMDKSASVQDQKSEANCLNCLKQTKIKIECDELDIEDTKITCKSEEIYIKSEPAPFEDLSCDNIKTEHPEDHPSQDERAKIEPDPLHVEETTTNASRKRRTFECNVCGKVFYKSGLKRHMLTHTGEKPFKCDACDKEFTQSCHLKVHKLKHVAPDDCDKRFGTTSELETHARPFKCEICAKRFTRASNLKLHMPRHTSREKPHRCDSCDKQFFTLADLRRHGRTHTGERPYGCDTCDRDFTQACHLKNHRRIHAAARERAYRCDVCLKRFYSPADLRKHVKTHTGEGPFKCEVCNLDFYRPAFLRRHLKLHEREDLYKELTK